jgi:hypothetical protein
MDSTQYYDVSAALAVLMLQVSVLSVLHQPHRREFQLSNSAVGRNLRGYFLARLVFGNDSGSSGPRVIVANLAIHLIPLAMFPTHCR